MIDFHRKKVVIIGLGSTGFSCINFFLIRGVIPRVIDVQIVHKDINKLPKQIEYHLGSLNDKWLLEADLIVLSPGVSLKKYAVLEKAMNYGVEIVGDIKLFSLEAKSPIIAITGSNGKSTVTTLVGEMLRAAGINVGIGGNIGVPALTLLDTPKEIYILELSSFQLETTSNLGALAATILNVTADHMDRYPLGLQQYRNTKLRIYEKAKICVVNTDDPLTIPENKFYDVCYKSFGIKNGDYHLDNRDGKIWICKKCEKILNIREVKIAGQHNYANILAALALVDAIGLPHSLSLKVLKNFNGLPYRFQLVMNKNGVRWINDSKATNVGSTIAALKNLYVKGTLYLLLGGYGKSSDFSLLRPCLTSKNLRLYCFGTSRSQLAKLRPEITKQTETMEQAIQLLAPKLQSGDVVLLSPACSSLDQFKSFEHRGNIFNNLAKELG